MVQHRIHIDLHARAAAALHHLRECLLVSGAAREVVGHRLVASPPRRSLDVFLRESVRRAKRGGAGPGPCVSFRARRSRKEVH